MNYEATLKSGIVLARSQDKLILLARLDNIVKRAKERITDDILIWDGYRVIAIARYSKSELKVVIGISEMESYAGL